MAISANPLRLLWPRIHDAASARTAARFGAVASILYCLGMAAISIYASFGNSALTLGSSGFVYAHIVAFAALAVGIWRLSRGAAIAALVLFLIDEVIVDVSSGGAQGVVFTGIFALLFVNGVRGTMASKRFATSTGPLM